MISISEGGGTNSSGEYSVSVGSGDLASDLVVSDIMVIEFVDGCSLSNLALDELVGGVSRVFSSDSDVLLEVSVDMFNRTFLLVMFSVLIKACQSRFKNIGCATSSSSIWRCSALASSVKGVSDEDDFAIHAGLLGVLNSTKHRTVLVSSYLC